MCAILAISRYTVYEKLSKFNVRGSMHHSIIHIENPTRCNSVSKL